MIRPEESYRLRAFSIIELLVVMVIIILLVGVAVPGLRGLMNAGRQNSAESSVSAAVAAVRAYTGEQPFFENNIEYEGVAIIVTPSNELRPVMHFEDADSIYTRRDATHSDVEPNAPDDRILHTGASAFIDIPNERYVTLAKGVGVVGISRVSATEPMLLAPPFAIRFNASGKLVARNDKSGTNGAVVYNGNYDVFYDSPPSPPGHFYSGDTGYDITSARPNDYDMAPWDPEISGRRGGNSADGRTANTGTKYYLDPVANYHDRVQRFMLPFEVLETVVGVIAFDKVTFLKVFPDGFAAEPSTGNLRPEVRAWLMTNGTVLMFNRYSGAVIKP